MIETDGKRYVWRDIVELRRAPLVAVRQMRQPALFELIDDCRRARHLAFRFQPKLLRKRNGAA